MSADDRKCPCCNGTGVELLEQPQRTCELCGGHRRCSHWNAAAWFAKHPDRHDTEPEMRAVRPEDT